MKTKAEITNYLKNTNPNFEQDNLDYYTDLIMGLIKIIGPENPFIGCTLGINHNDETNTGIFTFRYLLLTSQRKELRDFLYNYDDSLSFSILATGVISQILINFEF